MRDASSGEFKSDTGPPRYLVTSARGSWTLSLDRWTINRPLSIIHAGNYFFRPFYHTVLPGHRVVHHTNHTSLAKMIPLRFYHNKLREDINHSPAAWIKLSSRENRFVTTKLNAMTFKKEEKNLFFFFYYSNIHLFVHFQFSSLNAFLPYFRIETKTRRFHGHVYKSLRFPIEENRQLGLLQSIPGLIARDAVGKSANARSDGAFRKNASNNIHRQIGNKNVSKGPAHTGGNIQLSIPWLELRTLEFLKRASRENAIIAAQCIYMRSNVYV